MATILLIEDESVLARVIIDTLEKSGQRVLHACTGQTALQLCGQRQPDLIIIDWTFLALGGEEKLHTLRRISPAPVLMLLACNAESNNLTGIEFGADDFLSKPFSRGELRARVRALLHRAERVQQIVGADREHRTRSLTYQNLVLDAVHRRVTVDGRPVDLAPIEFDLLSLLVSSPGRVFSRAYLLETMWKDASVGEAQSIEIVVQSLRQKLGASAVIENVFGCGYRLKPVRSND